MTHTFIIAEAGANHNGSLEMAYQLIEIAATAGCDAVKFQLYDGTLYSKFSKEGSHKLLESIKTPYEWLPLLKKRCDHNNIEFMATPFDEQAIKALVDIGVKRIKVAGFESTDIRFIRLVAATNLPLIISLGIGTEDIYLRANNLFREIVHGKTLCTAKEDVTFLHCNNGYPTPLTDVNLLQLKKLASTGFNTGLSDHTLSTIVPALAVALGAVCIEKHFTTSRSLDGPDHAHALEPEELTEMVRNIRDAERVLTLRTGMTDSEKKTSFATRSVVALSDIKIGDIFTEDNITTKRPFYDDSYPAAYFYDILGYKASRNIKQDELLMRGDLK
ncbi:pseudaminic acid synthase [archaeon]|nr:pseudaminic acid synthase [archaeon]|tara:strand:- start:396 stop:1388 length:993 start_codon:yes stop_codon:yes gene_type:complete